MVSMQMPHLRPAAVLTAIGIWLSLVILSASPAAAVGEGDDMVACPRGLIWDINSYDCIALKEASVSDRNRAIYAYKLAKEGRFDETLLVLDSMVDPNTAEALNYRGYATRKLGRTDEGIGYYLKSIAMAPRYAPVREYLGEAYITKGRLDLAEEQLKVISTICGTECEEYEDLAEALKKASKG